MVWYEVWVNDAFGETAIVEAHKTEMNKLRYTINYSCPPYYRDYKRYSFAKKRLLQERFKVAELVIVVGKEPKIWRGRVV